MSLIVSLLTTTALAQSTIELPEINTQLYRPPVDSVRTLWADDTSYKPDWYTAGRVFFSYVDEPFTYTRGDTTTVLVDNVLQADLIGAVSYKRVRLGVDLPIYMLANGDTLQGNNAGLGDVALDLKGTILPREDFPVGLALAGRLGLPTATTALPLGDAGPGGEISAIADREFGDLLVVANLGTRFLPEVEMENVTLNDAFVFRLGGGYALSDATGVSLDLAGQPNYASDGNTKAPLEGLLGGWGRVADAFVLRGGIGTGLTDGIGSPQFRAVVSLAYEPPEVQDHDLDGLNDKVDACPRDPEDFDGYQDEDGCPDASTSVTVLVLDALSGEAVQGAAVTTSSPEGEGAASLTMHAAELSIAASADGYLENSTVIMVPAQDSYQAVIQLQPMGGTVKVKVSDEEGNPIEGYTWLVDKVEQESPESFARVGEHEVLVRASGFKPQRRQITAAHEQVVELEFVLESSQVKVTEERIEIDGKVYFDSAKATIKSKSHGLLDDVADILKAHHEITKLKIEGHTDNRGDDAYNLQLSKDRAAAVMQYLIDAGVEAERLESEGFGETAPIADNNSSKGREENRRVDFFVKERSDGPAQEHGAEKDAERQGDATEGASEEATQDAERQGGE